MCGEISTFKNLCGSAKQPQKMFYSWLGRRGKGRGLEGAKKKERKEGKKVGSSTVQFSPLPELFAQRKKRRFINAFFISCTFFSLFTGKEIFACVGGGKGKILLACQSPCLDADITRLLERRRKKRKKSFFFAFRQVASV